MTLNISDDDFVQLALRLRETVVVHEVPAEHRASLIEDVVFQFATFLDERLGSHFHESVFGLLDGHQAALAEVPKTADVLVAQVEVIFGKGRKKELNLLSGHLRNPDFLRELVELSLGLRSLDELDTPVDTEARFAKLMKTKDGIRSLRFNALANIDAPSWVEVSFDGAAAGGFEQSVSGVCRCLARVARQLG